jgi:hypothetical protein
MSEVRKIQEKVIDTIKRILQQECFPSVAIFFGIYLTVPCSVCEGDRSSSKRCLIKNENRETVPQDRLNASGLQCVKSDYVQKLKFYLLIQKF